MLCAVCGCNNNNNKNYKLRREDVSYFHFPKDPKLLKIWIRFCKRKDVFNPTTGRICSDHFTQDDIENNLQFKLGFLKKKRLKPGSVPSVFKITDKYNSSSQQSIFVAAENIHFVEKLESNETTDTEDEDECIETCLENATDPIDISDCQNCASLKKQMHQLHFKMNTMEEKCNQLILTETELKDKIKSLELELIQSKAQNCINENKLIAICSNVKKKKKVVQEKVIKQQRWSKSDIASSKTFYSNNSKAYINMRKNGSLLPSERTLQRWAKKAKNVSSGIEQPVATSLGAKVNLSEVEIVDTHIEYVESKTEPMDETMVPLQLFST